VWLFYALACVPKIEPVSAFPHPLPDPETPVVVELPAAPEDECLVAASLKPGFPPPFVVEGYATCRATVVPESQVLEWIRAENLGEWSADRLQLCHEYRGMDRTHCDLVVQALATERDGLRRDLAWARVAVPLAGLGGLIMGGAVAVAIAKAYDWARD
jgi:hypothetical protein